MEVRRQQSVSEVQPFPRRFVIVASAVTLVLLIVVAVTGIDISAMRDFERDVMMMRAPVPAGSQDRYFDPSPHSMWLPSDLFVWDSVRRGELPVWNRMQGGGYATLNAIHEGVLHPARWATAAFPRRSAPTILILITLAIAIIGMFVFARTELRCSSAAAALAAIVFAFSAMVISFVHFSGAMLPLAHIPWLVLFLRRRNALGLTLVLASLLVSGHPLLEACSIFTAGLVALADAIAFKSVRPLLLSAACGAIALLIASPAIVPPLLARGDLWTYKTETAQGTSYFAYSFPDWLASLRTMLIDPWKRAACCIDLDGFYLYVGVAAIALMFAGAFVLKERRVVILLIITGLIGVPGPWMRIFASLKPLSFFKPWYLIGAFAFFLAWVAAGGFEFLWRSRRSLRLAGIALALIVSVTYFVRANDVLRPRVARGPVSSPAIEFLRNQPGPFRIVSLWGQTHMPNASRITGIEDVRLAGPILTNRYHVWWQLIDSQVLSRAYPTTRITDQLQSPLVPDFNVRFIVQSRLAPAGTFRVNRDEKRRDAGLSATLMPLPIVFRTPWVEIRELPGTRPRAHFAQDVVTVPSFAEAINVLAREPFRTVVEADEPLRGGRAPAPVRAGEGACPPPGVRAVTYSSERKVAIETCSTTGGLVVLHDSFAEGWTATVDGRDAVIHPVNIASRGVVVPAGNHTIEMSYSPPGLTAGLALGAIGLLILVLLVIRGRSTRLFTINPASALL